MSIMMKPATLESVLDTIIEKSGGDDVAAEKLKTIAKTIGAPDGLFECYKECPDAARAFVAEALTIALTALGTRLADRGKTDRVHFEAVRCAADPQGALAQN